MLQFISYLLVGLSVAPGINAAVFPGPDGTPPAPIAPPSNKAPAFTPSAEILEAQKSYFESAASLDPVTNKTVSKLAGGSLARRAPFNPPSGAECRVVVEREHYVCLQCSPGHGCEPCDYQLSRARIINHQSGQEYYHSGELESGGWHYHQLDGHRGMWLSTWWDWNKLYGFGYALLGIEGRDGNRDMKGSPYCWYQEGSAWWGYWGTASCSVWCSEFNW